MFKRSWKEGNNWLIATDGGLKDKVGYIEVVVTDEQSLQECVTAQSNEECAHGHLHSTREELRAQLAAETILHD